MHIGIIAFLTAIHQVEAIDIKSVEYGEKKNCGRIRGDSPSQKLLALREGHNEVNDYAISLRRKNWQS
jgi:hypothetical protein